MEASKKVINNGTKPRKKKSQWGEVWRRLRKNKMAMLGLIILIILGIFLECEYMKDIQQGILNIAKK